MKKNKPHFDVKECLACKQTKPLTMFYVSKKGKFGRWSVCKLCNYHKRKEYIKKYHEAHSDKVWVGGRLSTKNWTKKNPHKRRAQKMIEWRIKTNQMERGACAVCGSLDSVAHHSDYSKPLDVAWLCGQHHRERHLEERYK